MFSRYIRPALSLVIAMTVLLGVIYPIVVTGVGSAIISLAGGWESHLCRQDTDRFPAHRPKIQRPEVFLGPAIRHLAPAV